MDANNNVRIGTDISLHIAMEERKTMQHKNYISPIVKICEDAGIGLLGFTVAYSEADFKNVTMNFTYDNYDLIWAELNQQRDELILSLNN